LILQTAECHITWLLQVVTGVFDMFQGAMWITWDMIWTVLINGRRWYTTWSHQGERYSIILTRRGALLR